ncbi:MAG: 3-hydroxyacyl-ACP dehydratase FabZ [Deltaproteobacteria bacterium]|nr:3-hydroxyacyl-ACP dehydratase FabZ [Deltaproteobacteria bacterium]
MPIRLNINQIMQYLPHRFPFLFIDAVEDVVPGKELRARKCVSINEMTFLGHFPDNPVVPGVLQIEAMGQCAALLGVLSGAKLDEDQSIYVTSITDCRFRKPVIPGDVMKMVARVERQRLGMWKFSCETRVNEDLVSEARITATSGPKVRPEPLPVDLPAPTRGQRRAEPSSSKES